jgi:cytochrome b pre-mRNA-processing protein 3
MGFFDKLFGQKQADPRDAMRPLYNQIVAKARQPHWYVEGGVVDSVDGRFDMVATILTVVLLRLEVDQSHAQESVFLTEIFVEDMDAQLREFGLGDIGIGKHVGKLMSALGGRLGAMRDALADGGSIESYVDRNLRVAENGNIPYLVAQFRALAAQLAANDSAALITGKADW